MQRFKVLVVALMGVCVLSAFFVSIASAALPVILNSKKEVAGAVSFKGNTAKTTEFSILEGFAVTKCTNTKTEGGFEAGKPLGTFHLTFTGCTTSLGGTCTGLGDASGEILVLGTYHVVYDVLTTLGAGVLFLLEHVHYGCVVAGINKLILVLGQVLCLITPIIGLAKTFTINCLGEKGDPKEVVYWNEAGTEVNIKEGLLASENEGVSYKMADQAGEGTFETSESIELMV